MELSFFNNSRSVEMVQSFLQKGALHDMSFLQVGGAAGAWGVGDELWNTAPGAWLCNSLPGTLRCLQCSLSSLQAKSSRVQVLRATQLLAAAMCPMDQDASTACHV